MLNEPAGQSPSVAFVDLPEFHRYKPEQEEQTPPYTDQDQTHHALQAQPIDCPSGFAYAKRITITFQSKTVRALADKLHFLRVIETLNAQFAPALPPGDK